MIVFDLTNRESFLHINDWIEEIVKFTGPNICKIVLANKCDLAVSRKVTKEEIQEFEKKSGIKVIETSAKSNYQVEMAFQKIVEQLIEKKYVYLYYVNLFNNLFIYTIQRQRRKKKRF